MASFSQNAEEHIQEQGEDGKGTRRESAPSVVTRAEAKAVCRPTYMLTVFVKPKT